MILPAFDDFTYMLGDSVLEFHLGIIHNAYYQAGRFAWGSAATASMIST
jgi:hypothetical protein